MNKMEKNKILKAGNLSSTFRFICDLISVNNVGNVKLNILISTPKHQSYNHSQNI